MILVECGVVKAEYVFSRLLRVFRLKSNAKNVEWGRTV